MTYSLYIIAPDGQRYESVRQKDITYSIEEALVGEYSVSITAYNVLGQKGMAYSTTVNVLGKTAVPVDVTGINLVGNNGSAIISWDLHPLS